MERNGADGMAVNIGSGEPITIDEVASTLAQSLGKQIPSQITGKFRAGDIRHCYGDITLAKRVLGYAPRYRFREGVKELVEWLGSQTAKDRAAEATERLTVYGLTA